MSSAEIRPIKSTNSSFSPTAIMDQEIKYLQKHNQLKIISEEKWENSIETIIQRDFFPDHSLLDAQIALFEAYESKDPVRIQKSQIELEKFKKPQKDNDKKNLSLNEFFQKYTSEDTASFSIIIEKTKQKQREKMKEYYNGKEVEQKSELKLLTAGDSNQPISLIGGPNHLNPMKKNALYYYEESETKGLPTNEKLPEKKINYENATYFEAKLPEIKLKKKTKDTVWNTTYGLEDVSTKNSDGTTPLIHGYKMVQTPTLDSIDNSVSELMSWGTVVDSIKIDDGPKFKMPETSQREKTAMSLLDKKSSTQKTGMMNSPTMKLMKKKSGFANSLKSSYTPSPVTQYSGVKTPRSDLKSTQPSPQVEQATKKTKMTVPKTSKDGGSITDNLLNL